MLPGINQGPSLARGQAGALPKKEPCTSNEGMAPAAELQNSGAPEWEPSVPDQRFHSTDWWVLTSLWGERGAAASRTFRANSGRMKAA